VGVDFFLTVNIVFKEHEGHWQRRQIITPEPMFPDALLMECNDITKLLDFLKR
jgi:hypothetical protein